MHILLIFLAFFASADQTVIPHYRVARGHFWKDLYSPTNNEIYKSFYCNKTFVQRNGFNIEHVFAASWMKGAIPGCKGLNRKECRFKSDRFNLMEADLHNLYPTINKANANRGSMIFGETEAEYFAPNCPLEIGDHIVEPPDYTKGRVARSILYMTYEYNIDLDKVTNSPGFEKEILEWNCKYEPTVEEIIRNDRIFKIQGTSNVFILDRDFCN